MFSIQIMEKETHKNKKKIKDLLYPMCNTLIIFQCVILVCFVFNWYYIHTDMFMHF